MSSPRPDILIFLSDQHTSRLMGCAGDSIVDTPNMDALANDGLRFSDANTACPLCVPARCAFMTGRLPAATGVFHNTNIMPSEVATFAHSCGAAGYDTVLCGRMHFTGQDQRHGFARRIMGDFTPCVHGRSGDQRADLGPYVGTPAGNWEKHFGGGDSPVLAYDRAVIEAACAELARAHDRPLLLVVGTYGPHHTFVAPEDLFGKYRDRVDPPLPLDAIDPFPGESAQTANKRLSEDDVRDLRAAYYGLIEQTDRHLGTVRAAWDEHLRRAGRTGVLSYVSDHGEMAGNRGMWGKTSFFADAVGIPMIVAGEGVARGAVCDAPVSLIDLTATICDLAGGPELPGADGRSLRPALAGGTLSERAVISEQWKGRAGRMIVTSAWKYWWFAGDEHEVLIDRRNDAPELRNVAGEHPDLCADLRERMSEDWDPAAIAVELARRAKEERLIAAWGANSGVEEPDRWVIPESSWALPKR